MHLCYSYVEKRIKILLKLFYESQCVEKKITFNFFILFTGEGDINDVLIKTLAEAHANTNLKLEIVHEMFRKPQVNRFLIF